ncbi:hypothetical protein O6H91_02G117400 [Diphasiastrum complanatum]|nr:hypothetical protein O6H91_02G117400 [Diphasiastrum complanatum]
MTSLSGSPCAACKFLRRKCMAECIFAPYFPPDQPQKFASVHKVFGASNISKILHELSLNQREDAVNSLAYEADARVNDPVYGCVRTISLLQRQVTQLQQELAMAHQDLARYAASNTAANPPRPNTQQTISISPLRINTGLHQTGPGPGTSGEQIFTGNALMEVTREQLLEIARFGGGSYEAGLRALGSNVLSFSPFGSSPSSRQGSS